MLQWSFSPLDLGGNNVCALLWSGHRVQRVSIGAPDQPCWSGTYLPSNSLTTSNSLITNHC